jgi:hypothetical protein
VDGQSSLSLDELDPARFLNGDQHRDD